MSCFDGKAKTLRAEGEPGTDQILPASRSLLWARIASRTALPGTDGEHAELVHGDFGERVSRNQNRHVLRDQVIKIDGKQNETFSEDCCQNFIGPQMVTNHTVRNETALARYTKVWGLATCEEDHSGYMKEFPSHWEQYDYSEDRHDLDNLYTTYAFSETVLQFQVDFAQVNAGVVQVALNGGNLEAEFGHAELRPIHFEYHPNPPETKIWLGSPQAALALQMKMD